MSGDGEVTYRGPWSGLNREMALHCLRARAPKYLALLERVLAAQGENAEPELVALQHELAEIIRYLEAPPAATEGRPLLTVDLNSTRK